jgi:predicted nucleotidyltransferase
MAIYAFGSQVQGTAGPQSNLDLAVLVAGYADPLTLWDVAGTLADIAGCPVDLLDLRAASTVMQYQVITTGQRLWSVGLAAGLFETYVLSEKTALDEARAPLLADINAPEKSMADDVLINKSATVERCVARAREEYARDPASFATDFTRQEAAILNVPQGARDVFELMARGGWIDAALADALKRMVAFRNIAVHDYQSLLLPILVSVDTGFRQFSCRLNCGF